MRGPAAHVAPAGGDAQRRPGTPLRWSARRTPSGTRAPRPPSFTAYSLEFDGLECDERPLIRDIQHRYGFRHRVRLAARLLRVAAARAPRGFRPSPVQGLNERDALFGAASEQGVRALLSGDFADAGIRGHGSRSSTPCSGAGRLRRAAPAPGRLPGLTGQPLLKTFALHGLAPAAAPVGPPAGERRRTPGGTSARSAGASSRGGCRRRCATSLSDRHLHLALEIGARDGASPTTPATWSTTPSTRPSWRPTRWAGPWRTGAPSPTGASTSCCWPSRRRSSTHLNRRLTRSYARSKRLLREAMRGILPESVRTRTVPTHFASFFAQDMNSHWDDRTSGPSGPGRVRR